MGRVISYGEKTGIGDGDYTHPNTAGYNKYYIPALEEFVFCELA